MSDINIEEFLQKDKELTSEEHYEVAIRLIGASENVSSAVEQQVMVSYAHMEMTKALYKQNLELLKLMTGQVSLKQDTIAETTKLPVQELDSWGYPLNDSWGL